MHILYKNSTYTAGYTNVYLDKFSERGMKISSEDFLKVRIGRRKELGEYIFTVTWSLVKRNCRPSCF